MAFLAREMAGPALESPARTATTGFFIRRFIESCESKNYLKEKPIHYKFTALYSIRIYLRRSCTTRANGRFVKSGNTLLEARGTLLLSPAFILSSSAGFYNVLLKMHSSFLIGGLSLIFCCQAAFSQTLAVPPTGPITLTLQDAMQRARQYEQQIYSANIAAQLAHEDTVQAKAALLPTAEGQSGYIYTQPNGTA